MGLPGSISRKVSPRSCAHVSIVRPQNSGPLSVRSTRGSPRLTASDSEHPFEQVRTTGEAQRILVVDDNVDAAESLTALLRVYGHEVHMVHDGPAALELAPSLLPSIVLLDIGMPGMDGYKVA